MIWKTFMNGVEQQIRNRLGIPPAAKYILVIDQSAHMDWDWTSSFPQYFSTEVDKLLIHAVRLLSNNAAPGVKAPGLYYYSVCEMGFFQKFVQTQIAQGIDILAKLRAAGSYLRIVGGGITSPDCLLCSGEGFLRNYLVGKLWLADVLPELLPLKHCWLPDDFGQDPELPVAVKALGMTSISFSRLPGIPPNGNSVNDPQLEMEMLTSGADFWWTCSDNASVVFTHWMPGPVPGYFQGGALSTCNGKPVAAIQDFLQCNNPDLTTYTPPFSAAPANYVYMPIDDDFMMPIPDLLSYVSTWNTNWQKEGVYAVETSYDDFVSLVLASGASLRSRAYNGTPYYTGYYMSRPELKVLHYGASRTLLAAEVFGLLAAGNGAPSQVGVLLDPLYWNRLFRAWNDFAPSTHHDYICGTAYDWVTELEQVPLLQTAYGEAKHAAEDALNALAASVNAASEVMIVNPAGVPFAGSVELPGPVPRGMESITVGNTSVPVQASFEGGLVFAVPAATPSLVPSMGYTTASLSTQAAPAGSATASISPASSEAAAYTLQNDCITVVVSAESNWGISSIQDASGTELLAAGSTGNDLVFYTDPGNLYQFGNEMPGAAFGPAELKVTTSGPGLGASVLESGPVRVRLKTVVSIAIVGANSPGLTYTREYSLAAGEPFLRMTTTGAAPIVDASTETGCSVMTAFSLAGQVTSISHGTACHWTSGQPLGLWTAPIFRATHNFLLAEAGNGSVLAAIYHPEVPAWGYDPMGALLGCLLRNTPGTQRGASGSDAGVHTLRYAFRVPSGLEHPSTGQPLTEALNYVSPAAARIVPVAPSSPNGQGPQTLAETGCIASVSQPGVIQAAKPGDVVPGTLILRIYQPSNAPRTLTVTLGQGKPAAVIAVTALEDPITSGAPDIHITTGGFTIQAVTALNTVQISF
jgi:alpha-mannosidase